MDHFKYKALPSQGQGSLGPEFHNTGRTLIQCTGLPDNGDPLWMGQTLEGWWLRGTHGENSWIELPAGMQPNTTHVRLGVNNESPTEAAVDPPRLPNQVELPYSWLDWAWDGQCTKVVDGKHQFLCHTKCFGDPYQGVHHILQCAVARSAWVAKNPRRRAKSHKVIKDDHCKDDRDCVPNPDTAKWGNGKCHMAMYANSGGCN